MTWEVNPATYRFLAILGILESCIFSQEVNDELVLEGAAFRRFLLIHSSLATAAIRLRVRSGGKTFSASDFRSSIRSNNACAYAHGRVMLGFAGRVTIQHSIENIAVYVSANNTRAPIKQRLCC